LKLKIAGFGSRVAPWWAIQALLELPLQVVGQRAEEDVTSNSIIGLVVDGPYFELHGFETAEGFLD
jgi:hypothetical protein